MRPLFLILGIPVFLFQFTSGVAEVGCTYQFKVFWRLLYLATPVPPSLYLFHILDPVDQCSGYKLPFQWDRFQIAVLVPSPPPTLHVWSGTRGSGFKSSLRRNLLAELCSHAQIWICLQNLLFMRKFTRTTLVINLILSLWDDNANTLVCMSQYCTNAGAKYLTLH